LIKWETKGAEKRGAEHTVAPETPEPVTVS
jgi:hypothetical protein